MIISFLMRWLKVWPKNTVTDEHKQELRNIFYAHFMQGTSCYSLELKLNALSNDINCSAYELYSQDLFWETTNEDVPLYQETLQFLRNICLNNTDLTAHNEEKCKQLMRDNNNLYALLLALENDSDVSYQTHHLKNLILKAYPRKKWLDVAVFGTLLAATGIAVYATNFSYLLETFDWLSNDLPQGILWLVLTLSSPAVVPFLGLAFHILVLSAKVFFGFYYGQSLNPNRNSYLASETLRISLIVTGHILTALYLGVASMSLPIAFIFIAASIVELSHAIYQCYIESSKQIPHVDNPSREVKLHLARLANKNERLQAEILLHLSTISCLVICVFCWNLLQPSLFLSLLCVLFIVAILGSESIFRDMLHDTYATKLQNTIAAIPLDEEENRCEELDRYCFAS